MDSPHFSNFSFRLRHVYGELDGSWGKLLADQTWSTFMNLNSAPETVDFNGHGSAAFVRQSMIRYVVKLGTAGDLARAVENPHGTLDGGTAQATPNIDKRPHLVPPTGAWRAPGEVSPFKRFRPNTATTMAPSRPGPAAMASASAARSSRRRRTR